MDISSENGKTSGNLRSDFFLAVLQTVRGSIRRLVEFFTLTEAEQTKAGIYIRRRGA
jgi:hypothetical protein